MRDSAINDLVNDDMNTIENDNGWYLSSLLTNGFKGYSNYTDNELMQELKERGLEEGYGI